MVATNKTASGFSRRRFAAVCGCGPALAVCSSSTWSAGDLQPFLALSARLTGFPAAALDVGFGDGLLRALADSGRKSELDALLRDGTGSEELEAEIIAAWYGGILPTASGAVVGTLYGALVWATVDFATPPGICVGPGSWREPPQLSDKG